MADLFGDDFDENGRSRSKSDFASLFEASAEELTKNLSVGDKITTSILTIGKDECFVSTGTMKDGVILNVDLIDKDGKLNVSVGESLNLFVYRVTDTQVFLSPKPTSKNIAEDLEDAFDMMLPVEGRVTEVVKGGFRVSLRGQSAFCPISQMDQKRIEDSEEYLNKKFEFLITQFERKNIVVSRRKLLDEQKESSQGEFVEDHKVGGIVSGRITRLEPYGAFVELAPGLDGLCHISELSWSRLAEPAEAVKIGDDHAFKVLKIEDKGGRLNISLSLKQAQDEPWSNPPEEMKEGNIIVGRVTRCMKFGCFVEIVPGIEGLVPLSEMSYTQRVNSSDELMKEGETVSVMVKEIRPDDRRVLLSLKDAGEDPWAMVAHRFPVGALAKGKVQRKEAYGVFVQLEEGVIALLPKSKTRDHADFNFDKTSVGDGIIVRVDELNLAERKISLGLAEDSNAEAWSSYQKQTQASGASMGTLGDQFASLLSSKKN